MNLQLTSATVFYGTRAYDLLERDEGKELPQSGTSAELTEKLGAFTKQFYGATSTFDLHKIEPLPNEIVDNMPENWDNSPGIAFIANGFLFVYKEA